MQKETEEIATEAVDSLCQWMMMMLKRIWVSDFFSKWQKKSPDNPVSTVQSKTKQLPKKEYFW